MGCTATWHLTRRVRQAWITYDNVNVMLKREGKNMQWNSVKNGLPKTTKQTSWYIVNTSKGVGLVEFNPIDGFSNQVFIDNSQHYGLDITHWMGLPPPPSFD